MPGETLVSGNIDTYSKWPEIHVMEANTTTRSTIEKLQDIFVILGLSEIILSDNGPQFTAQQFGEYCTSRGIKNITTPPYDPKSNGEAERLVGIFKTYMKKAHLKTIKDLHNRLRDFLALYCSTPHTITSQTPL